MFDLPAHLKNMFFRLNHVRTSHEKKWLRTLDLALDKYWSAQRYTFSSL